MKKIFVSTIGMLFVVSTTMFGMAKPKKYGLLTNVSITENFNPKNIYPEHILGFQVDLIEKNLPKKQSNIYELCELETKNYENATIKFNQNNCTTMEEFVNLLVIEQNATLAKFKELLYEKQKERTFKKRKKNKGYGYFANLEQ